MPSSRNPQQFPDDFLKRVLRHMNEGFDRLARERLMNREDSIKRHEEVVSFLKAFAEDQTQPVLGTLNELEREIVEALGKDTLTGEQIAKRVNRAYDSTIKTTLAGMKRRKILGNRCPGYYVVRRGHD